MTEEQRKRKNQRDRERRARIKAEKEGQKAPEPVKSPPIAFASPLDCRVHYRGVDSDEAFFENTRKRMSR